MVIWSGWLMGSLLMVVEPLTDEQVACLDRLELEWTLLASADAGAEIAIFGAIPQSGNCNAPKESDPF
jgi:hypothetical protein